MHGISCTLLHLRYFMYITSRMVFHAHYFTHTTLRTVFHAHFFTHDISGTLLHAHYQLYSQSRRTASHHTERSLEGVLYGIFL